MVLESLLAIASMCPALPNEDLAFSTFSQEETKANTSEIRRVNNNGNDIYNTPHAFDNTFSTLKTMVNVLSQIAKDNDSTDIPNDVMGYIRSFNSQYTSTKWTMLAGKINESYVNKVNNSRFSGITPYQYFSSFYEGYLLENPFFPHGIDLLHMFATMDGCYGAAHAGTCMCDLFGWAGDLQQAANHLQTGTIASFENDILAVESSGCPYDDFYADICGQLIALYYMNDNLGYSLERFQSYYAGKGKLIYLGFIEMLNENDWTDNGKSHNVGRLIYHVMDIDDKTHKDLPDDNFVEYYILCHFENNREPTVPLRDSLATAFINYLSSQIL